MLSATVEAWNNPADTFCGHESANCRPRGPTQTATNMKRYRTLLIVLAAGALAVPLMTFAQEQKIHRIGYLANQPDPRTTSTSFKAFIGALRELGWIEGRNIEIRIRSAGGRDERFPDLAAE